MENGIAVTKPDARLVVLVASMAALGASGCRAIEGIFKAGIWMGVLGAIVLVALAVGLFKMVRGAV